MTEQIPPAAMRPFESLEWYRDATRSSSGGHARFLDWARGIGFLSVHVSVYALGTVAMFVVNLLRAPDAIWVDRATPIWTLIVVIHAGVVGLLWAIGQLDREDDEPIRIVTDLSWRQAKTWPGDGPVGAAPEALVTVAAPPLVPHPPQDRVVGLQTTQQFRPASSPSAGQSRVGAPASRETKWSGWESESPQRIAPDDPNRASWQEAAAAAWRDRAQSGSTAEGEPPKSG